MIFGLTIYGIFSGICEIDYSADLRLDVESFELPTTSGFEFQLPAERIPILWDSNNVQYEIESKIILRTDLSITLVDATGISVDDYFWIGTEKIKVTSVTGNVIGIERGVDSTHINRHFKDEQNGLLLFMNTLPTSFVGLKVTLIKNSVLYSVGVIENEPKFKDGVLTFSCSDVIETLDVPLPKYYKNDSELEIVSYFNLLQDTSIDFKSTSDESFLLGSIPDFFDYYNIYGLGLSNDIIKLGSVVVFNKISTYKDLIIALLKSSKSAIFFDRNIGEYQTIQITPTLSFETPPEIKMLDYMKSDGGYSISMSENIKTVIFTYQKNKEDKKITANLTNIAFGKTLDVDLSGFLNINTQGIYSLILRYLYDTSLYYSIVEIESTKMIVNDLQVGKIYQFTDVLNYSFQNISSKCIYLGNEDDNLFFGIIRDFQKTLIAPAIPVNRTGTKQLTFGFKLIDGYPDTYFEVADFLNTNSTNVENALFKNRGYEIPYFRGDNQKVQLFLTSGALLSAEEIDFINGNVITLVNDVADNNYWLVFDVYVNVSDEQKKFFYYNVNRY